MSGEHSFMANSVPPAPPPLAAQPSNGTPPSANSQNVPPGHPSFRRQRASRACESESKAPCNSPIIIVFATGSRRLLQVRCDAASLGIPCTNCTAFSIECRIPQPKRKKTQGPRTKTEGSERGESEERSPASASVEPRDRPALYNSEDGTPATTLSSAYAAQQATHNGTYVQFMKPKFARAPIKEAGRVAYLGESSNLSLLVHDHGTTDVVHYPLPENVRGAKARVNEMDNMEIEILHQRGAFLLPPRALCDELVDAFFKWVAPVVPVINRSRFMRQYRDPKNPPSLLLLQAVLLAGSRVCTNAQLMDSSGSTTPAAMTFYKRAKALFDANFEDDRVTIVQALILMGWYWEGPEDVTKNVFYWTRVAIVVAQGSGMHRSVEGSQLSRSDKRLWKRIWWTLYSRDRSVAVALGRPVAIDPEDSDVEMVSEDDFIDDEADHGAEYAPDPIHVQFFINYVKLSEIMGLVLSQQYSVASKHRRANAIDLTHSDMALADWLQHCPPEVQWDRQNHHFWAALLHSNYYTTLCLLHRAHMPPAGSPKSNDLDGFGEEHAYPSRNIAYQAAAMITSIIENLRAHDEIRYTPAFIVYSLFSALIMHVYQMKSSNKSIVSATEQRIQICLDALKEVSKVWLVAKMVHTLFESILGNKHLEERLQKAAGRNHKKNKVPSAPPPPPKPAQEAPKRKFDDMDLGFPATNGPPAPQVSYERSRPQTPAVTPSRELPPQQMPQMSTGSPQMNRQNHDAFMGPSRSGTRPTTPFNPSYSYPGTPPDLFLVTRDTPNISQEVWQNFQPDHLFPADTQVAFPVQNQSLVDPALSQPQHMPMHQQSQQQGSQQPVQNGPSTMGLPGTYDPNQQTWTQHLESISQSQQQHGAQEDTWSQSSGGRHNPIVPTSLNVDDWYVAPFSTNLQSCSPTSHHCIVATISLRFTNYLRKGQTCASRTREPEFQILTLLSISHVSRSPLRIHGRIASLLARSDFQNMFQTQHNAGRGAPLGTNRLQNGKLGGSSQWGFGAPMGGAPGLPNAQSRTNGGAMSSFAQAMGGSQPHTPLNLDQSANQQQQNQVQDDSSQSQFSSAGDDYRFGGAGGVGQLSGGAQPQTGNIEEFPPLGGAAGEIGPDRRAGLIQNAAAFGSNPSTGAFPGLGQTRNGLSSPTDSQQDRTINPTVGGRGLPGAGKLSEVGPQDNLLTEPVSRTPFDNMRATPTNLQEGGQRAGQAPSNLSFLGPQLGVRGGGGGDIAPGAQRPQQSQFEQTFGGDGIGSPNAPPLHKKLADMTDSERYGLPGLLSMIPLESPDYSSLAMGQDLTVLGLELSRPDHSPLHPTFGSPFVESTSKPVIPPSFTLPAAYTVTNVPPLHSKMSSFTAETLLAIFYQFPRDILQEIAASELYNRDWRWHINLRQWMMKDPDLPAPLRLSPKEERGWYLFFDVGNWRRERREFELNYDHLDQRHGSPAMAGQM
ncbi:hypothetical protein T440DRAFT_489679 [Plenodomus tracheiphilus IPT5]|uniref:Xylanolytic transcriptional activator regulatory domain-containing protein n=1 Tax=Plenodomus tracheiphilus IPT5 TaxID=1408161 RepID=A0A6A7B844_9PLEO|nr:hypothetical protein T440DRAFT_489679 [Plenodomus tracheiphilus IPT5]